MKVTLEKIMDPDADEVVEELFAAMNCSPFSNEWLVAALCVYIMGHDLPSYVEDKHAAVEAIRAAVKDIDRRAAGGEAEG